MSATVWQRGLVGLVTLVVLGGGAGFLGLSYLGVISSDVRVRAELLTLGDALGPGSKVRYDGLVVGRVHAVEATADGPVATLLVDADQADAIPADATARVLPATAFGSEYVEIVAPAGGGGDVLVSGTTLSADMSEHSIRLMDSFQKSQRLLRAIDVEGVSRATGVLAAAIDGRGDDVGRFIERADRLATSVNADSELLYGTLADLTAAGAVVDDLLPTTTRAAKNARTTARTLVERSDDLGRLIASTTALAGTIGTTVGHHGTAIDQLLDVTGGPIALFAAHTDSLASILSGAPRVLHNGATSIDGKSIQMNGLIGLDPLDPYTADDCPRYGDLMGANCGGEVPPELRRDDDVPPGLLSELQDLLGNLSEPGPDPTPAPPAGAATTPTTGTPTTPAPSASPGVPLLDGLQQLLHGLLGGGAP